MHTRVCAREHLTGITSVPEFDGRAVGTRKTTLDEEKTAGRYDLFVLIIIALITPREACASTTFRRYKRELSLKRERERKKEEGEREREEAVVYVVYVVSRAQTDAIVRTRELV